jgi:Ca2+-binding RTX toxin-like protein
MADPFFNAAYYLAHNPDVAAAGYTLATAEQQYDRYGATEGRSPNIWFNAAAYLAAYPDLASHGVTAATAFQHYITYGLNEDRSPAANVNPANFSYADYATANPDLKAAFGITDPAHLTADQQHQLLGHFLSFGYLENRPGIVSTDGNSFFAQFDHTPIQNDPPPAPPLGMNIAVDGSHMDHIYAGAGGDDVFTGVEMNVNGATLNGAGGNDTLNVNFGLPFPFAASATVNSIEKINVDFGFNPLVAQFTVTTADTPSLSIGLTVAGSVLPSNLTVTSGNAALHTLTVDGSSATGNLVVDLTSSTLAGVDVTLTGGAGNDTFSTAVGTGHKATLNGGAGNDTLNGSLGQDIMTGGPGNDIFHFGAGTAAPINLATATVDTITDFNVGDTLQFGSTSSNSPFFQFAGNNLALGIATLLSNAGPNFALLFSTADDMHYFVDTGNGVTPAAVIKIVLAAGLDWNNMVVDTSGAHYVAPV